MQSSIAKMKQIHRHPYACHGLRVANIGSGSEAALAVQTTERTQESKVDKQPESSPYLLTQAMCLDSPELSNVQNVERLVHAQVGARVTPNALVTLGNQYRGSLPSD